MCPGAGTRHSLSLELYSLGPLQKDMAGRTLFGSLNAVRRLRRGRPPFAQLFGSHHLQLSHALGNQYYWRAGDRRCWLAFLSFWIELIGPSGLGFNKSLSRSQTSQCRSHVQNLCHDSWGLKDIGDIAGMCGSSSIDWVSNSCLTSHSPVIRLRLPVFVLPKGEQRQSSTTY